MKVVLTLLVRDEIDIIQSNIEYHLSNGVDFIIATDNGSVDGTTQVLKAYEKKGKLEYIYQPPSDFSQGLWVTHMARRAYTHYGADWVINSDCDEFFVPKFFNKTLNETLACVPKHMDKLSIQRHDFVPFTNDSQSQIPEKMIYRKLNSTNIQGEPLPPKVIHRGVNDARITQGNHNAESELLSSSTMYFSGIEVFHYPIRSYPQFISKVNNGGSGYSKNQHLPQGCGFHKRYWYELLLQGKLECEYRSHFFNSQRLLKALCTGEIIEDRSLRKHLEDQKSLGATDNYVMKSVFK
jgi:glycosyltransferase involved in cell wall biosynthesis